MFFVDIRNASIMNQKKTHIVVMFEHDLGTCSLRLMVRYQRLEELRFLGAQT